MAARPQSSKGASAYETFHFPRARRNLSMSDVPSRSPADIIRLRNERLIPSLTLSYNPEPLKIVKVGGLGSCRMILSRFVSSAPAQRVAPKLGALGQLSELNHDMIARPYPAGILCRIFP